LLGFNESKYTEVMKVLIQIKAVFIALVLLFLVLFPACLVAIPFPLHRRLKIVCPVWAFFSKALLRYACHAHLDISDDLRSPEFKTVPAFGLYVANHQSYVDIPVILTMFQVPPIMKKEVLYIPLFGLLGWISGALIVSRGKMNSRKKVFEQTKKRILKERIGVQVYPEGTRSKDALPKSIDEIKKTLLVFAFQEKIPVIPTSIYGTRGVLGKNGFIQPNRHLGIIVHREVNPIDFSDAESFVKEVWGKVIAGHNQMKNQLSPLN
jgi:1-acyl-sn-glycerol-3-phosphate acyltransferase